MSEAAFSRAKKLLSSTLLPGGERRGEGKEPPGAAAGNDLRVIG